MADPNSTTGLIFHEKVGPGGTIFPWNIGPLDRIFQDQNSPDRSFSCYKPLTSSTWLILCYIIRLISLASVNNILLTNVLGIIGTFLENYQGFFENLRIANKLA